jgi:hypothetical protein
MSKKVKIGSVTAEIYDIVQGCPMARRTCKLGVTHIYCKRDGVWRKVEMVPR